jgi:hypothetical protein
MHSVGNESRFFSFCGRGRGEKNTEKPIKPRKPEKKIIGKI